MRLGIIEGPLVSVLHSSANKYVRRRCGGEPRPCGSHGVSSAGADPGGSGAGGSSRGCSFSLWQLLEQGFPFICYLHTLAIGIEFVPIKTKLVLPGILNRLWQSRPLTLWERFLQIPPLQAHNAPWKPLQSVDYLHVPEDNWSANIRDNVLQF